MPSTPHLPPSPAHAADLPVLPDHLISDACTQLVPVLVEDVDPEKEGRHWVRQVTLDNGPFFPSCSRLVSIAYLVSKDTQSYPTYFTLMVVSKLIKGMQSIYVKWLIPYRQSSLKSLFHRFQFSDNPLPNIHCSLCTDQWSTSTPCPLLDPPRSNPCRHDDGKTSRIFTNSAGWYHVPKSSTSITSHVACKTVCSRLLYAN
jgi:hypothetical protein